jgi:hypothetical protein
VLLAGVFVAIERRIAAPLLNLAVLGAPGLRAGLVTLVFQQIAYGGLIFTLTLHLGAGLGDGPLRIGLTYVPMSLSFGLVGFFWRRLPARVHPFLAPAGMVVCAVGYLAIASGMAGGGHGGALAATGLVLTGVGMGLSVSPVLTQSLLRVTPAHAADASGILTTFIQLGQVTGVAAFGTLFLTVHSLPSTASWLAVAAAASAMSGAVLTRSLIMVRIDHSHR